MKQFQFTVDDQTLKTLNHALEFSATFDPNPDSCHEYNAAMYELNRAEKLQVRDPKHTKNSHSAAKKTNQVEKIQTYT